MSETDDILSGVQAAIAEVLGINPEEAQPSLSYLVDLAGGESLELLDLQFRLDKRFGVRIAGIGNFAGAEADAEGRFTPAGMESLRKSVPASLLDRFRDRPAPTARDVLDAMTVEDIANMVRLALAAKQDAQVAPTGEPAGKR
jgi:acyl carrier protein